MSMLLTALDESAPTRLSDIGGSVDTGVFEALSATLAVPAEGDRVVAGLTRDQAWALLGWAEGACSWAVRVGSPEIVEGVFQSLALLDGKLDRRDLLLVATLARRAARRLDTDLEEVARSSQLVGHPLLPEWIATATEELPSTHVEEGHGQSFAFRREPPGFDPTELWELLRDDGR